MNSLIQYVVDACNVLEFLYLGTVRKEGNKCRGPGFFVRLSAVCVAIQYKGLLLCTR